MRIGGLKMLIALCALLICSSVVANDYQSMTYDEIKDLINSLQTSAPDQVVYARTTTEAYPTSTEASVDWTTVDSDDDEDHHWYTTDPSYQVVTVEEHVQPEQALEECDDSYVERQPQTEEEFVEEYHTTLQVGSTRGVPGIHFPDYSDIPLTSFHCSEKSYIPGFYADLETGCQVFHVCWPHRRESFLCPLGTTFNQAILACDHWYSSNCSLAPHYYDVNAESSTVGKDLKKEVSVGSMIDSLLERGHREPTEAPSDEPQGPRPVDASFLMKFLPVKAKVVVFPETSYGRGKIVAEASVGKTKKRKVLKPTEDTEGEYMPVQPSEPVAKVVGESKRKPMKPIEEPVTEDIYIPVQTEEPVQPVHKVSFKHKLKPMTQQERDVDRIIDQVFDIAKRIVKEGGGLLPAFQHLAVSHRMKPAGEYVVVKRPVAPAFHTKAHVVPLTKLNPRFITLPAHAGEHEVKYEGHPEVAKAFIHHKAFPKLFKVRKPVTKTLTHHLYATSTAKKPLSQSYLKLFKIKG